MRIVEIDIDDEIPSWHGEREILLRLAAELKHIKNQQDRNHHEIMSALENLTASVASLTTSVDNAVLVLGTPHPTDAQVQQAADAINAQVARLNAAAGVTPTPAPTP